DASQFHFLHGPELISESESPVQALNSKSQASIAVALQAHHENQVDAVVSAGSTGAQVVASISQLGLLEEVLRPAIGGYFPTIQGKTLLLDLGANETCRPIHLLQFAAMGTIFRQYLDGIEEPTVALLSNGEESRKGNQVTRDAYELFKVVSAINFIGNIEGNDIYNGKADIVICDGFTGNILLKFAESIPEMLKRCTKDLDFETANDKSLLGYLIRAFDYQEFGGAPLLGVNGVSVICHGHSTAKAIMNAIGEAMKMVKLRVNDRISQQLADMGHWSAIIKTKALIGRFRWRSIGDKH
ncbi:MAG: phosphate acyltransferase PlsX, partial [bacterium]